MDNNQSMVGRVMNGAVIRVLSMKTLPTIVVVNVKYLQKKKKNNMIVVIIHYFSCSVYI